MEERRVRKRKETRLYEGHIYVLDDLIYKLVKVIFSPTFCLQLIYFKESCTFFFDRCLTPHTPLCFFDYLINLNKILYKSLKKIQSSLTMKNWDIKYELIFAKDFFYFFFLHLWDWKNFIYFYTLSHTALTTYGGEHCWNQSAFPKD